MARFHRKRVGGRCRSVTVQNTQHWNFLRQAARHQRIAYIQKRLCVGLYPIWALPKRFLNVNQQEGSVYGGLRVDEAQSIGLMGRCVASKTDA